MIPPTFEYYAPANVGEAVAFLSEHGEEAKLLAGGHSLLPMMKLRFAEPEHLIDLNNINELRGILEEGDIAHGDPGNDHPALMLALDAVFTLTGPNGSREVCEPAEDLRGDVEYKTHMVGEMARRALLEAVSRAGGN